MKYLLKAWTTILLRDAPQPLLIEWRKIGFKNSTFKCSLFNFEQNHSTCFGQFFQSLQDKNYTRWLIGAGKVVFCNNGTWIAFFLWTVKKRFLRFFKWNITQPLLSIQTFLSGCSFKLQVYAIKCNFSNNNIASVSRNFSN